MRKPRRRNADRSSRGICVWGAAFVSTMLLANVALVAGVAHAQRGGLSGLDRIARYDWDVEQSDLTDVLSRDLKKAWRRGVIDLKHGNCRDATRKFEFLLGHIEDDPTIYYAAATAARCARAFRAAAGYYESAIEFEPSNYEAMRFLGVSRLALGDMEEANEVLAALDLERIACARACAPELEAAYAELRGAVATAYERASDD